MNQIAQFLADAKTFYLATTEADQPRVRPFGAVAEWDGKTYICTNNKLYGLVVFFFTILNSPK